MLRETVFEQKRKLMSPAQASRGCASRTAWSLLETMSRTNAPGVEFVDWMRSSAMG
jgi:hypothetical protein